MSLPLRLEAPWLTMPASRRVLAALATGGRPARFVGGCVRDALLAPGADVADLDLATPEPPERVLALLDAAGIAAIPTGLRHGTVTAHLAGHRYEITTLRRDVACFGRHAEVAFTDDFAADAARRDFTINALSCDGDGRLHDPVGGLADLRAGRVRFVGEPRRRIAEDFLRILRFFRFHVRFGRGAPDAAALAACAELGAGIDRLSGERIRQELFGILATPRAAEALALMQAAGVLGRVLPGAADLATLRRLVATAPEADPLLRLAAVLRRAAPDVVALAARLRLANVQAERLALLLATPLPDTTAPAPAQRLLLYRLGPEVYADLVRLAAATGAAEPADAVACLERAAAWRPPVFPLKGADLLARGLAPGPGIGRRLAAVRRWWEERDFHPDRAACLACLDLLLAEAPIAPQAADSPARSVDSRRRPD